METHPFLPLPVRYRATRLRVIRCYQADLGRRAAAACFARCIDDLHQLGLQGNAWQ